MALSGLFAGVVFFLCEVEDECKGGVVMVIHGLHGCNTFERMLCYRYILAYGYHGAGDGSVHCATTSRKMP